jgi:tripartite-type tricarboxylate transporter receptor subunit TctC
VRLLPRHPSHPFTAADLHYRRTASTGAGHNRRLNAGLAERATEERLDRLGLDPAPTDPAGAAAYLKADSEKWAEVIRRIGLVVD